MVFDHPTFRCFPPLQPLALSTLRPRHSGASLGWIVQHAHTGSSYHNNTQLLLLIRVLFILLKRLFRTIQLIGSV